MEQGFITALGTPLDGDGALIAESFVKQIHDQIDAKAAALLVMGSMGNEAYIRASTYPVVAKVAVDAVGGRLPVLVGVMDCSIGRVRDRIAALEGLAIDGVVATAPFYYATTQQELSTFFLSVADESPFPLYLYDLVPVTQTPIAPKTVAELMKHPNIRGIKSGVLPTCRVTYHAPDRPEDFLVMYSGLDAFDVAWSYGLRRNLDGMFSCTPGIAKEMYEALEAGNLTGGRIALDRILKLRNTFIEVGVLKGFTVAMNALGYAGSFAQDFVVPATEEEAQKVRACMTELNML